MYMKRERFCKQWNSTQLETLDKKVEREVIIPGQERWWWWLDLISGENEACEAPSIDKCQFLIVKRPETLSTWSTVFSRPLSSNTAKELGNHLHFEWMDS